MLNNLIKKFKDKKEIKFIPLKSLGKNSGKLVYCATPSRIAKKSNEITSFVSKLGLAPLHPFLALPYEFFEGNPIIGREKSMNYCCKLIDICDIFCLFGPSKGTSVIELPYALAKGKIIAYDKSFDENWEEYIEKLKVDSPLLKQFEGQNMTGTLPISWEEFDNLVKRLVKKITKNKYDSIVCISSGGLTLGKLVSDHLNIPLAVISAQIYKKGEKKLSNKNLVIGTIAGTSYIKGNILLIDDLVDTGVTIKAIKEHLMKIREIKNVDTATIFLKPWSSFQPDYCVAGTSKWIVFPYERNEFIRETTK